MFILLLILTWSRPIPAEQPTGYEQIQADVAAALAECGNLDGDDC